ncbi:MAG: hypothetical protein ABJO02_11930, partial [Reichenbachiella sp.]|uniref:hypothetical protein n=1 Tax=Reichenbachiella sp. TaxID=2184521 RepID=UPI0032974A7B
MKIIFRLTLVLFLCSSSWTVIAQGPAPPCPGCEEDPDPGDGGGGDPPPPDPCEYGPSGNPSPTNITASSGVCNGKSVLSYNGTPAQNVVWVWYRNGTRLTSTVVTDAMTSTTKSFNVYSSGTYQLYREWEFCNNGPKASFATKTVTVTPAPSVNITKNESTSCVGQSVSLTANTTNFGSNPTYAWRQNGVGSVLHTGQIFKIPEDEYVTPGNRSFTVTVTGVSTCNGISKTATSSIEIPGTLSSLEFLGGGLYCNEESDNINSFTIKDTRAKRDLWMDYEFEVWKSTNGSTFNTMVANEKGINHDFKDSGEHYGNDHYFQLTMTPRDGENFGTGWYKLKMIKSGCTPLWDENVLTTQAVTYQEVELLPGSEYVYKCEDNYVEIHTTHQDAVLYSSHSDMTPVSGMDYSGSSIKGNIPACDFDCSYYVGLPSGYCVSPGRKEVAFRKVGPVQLSPKVFPPQDALVECPDSETAVTLKVDPSRNLIPPVSHPESFPIEEAHYPIHYRWYGPNLPVLNDNNVNNEITVNLGVGEYTSYQVAAYTLLCPEDNLEDGPKGTVGSFTISNEKPKPDAPVLENLTTCFTGTAELKASFFEAYTWYKDGSTSGITETGSELSFALESSNLGTYKVSAKYGDDPACV